jgi:hypothetical protein
MRHGVRTVKSLTSTIKMLLATAIIIGMLSASTEAGIFRRSKQKVAPRREYREYGNGYQDRYYGDGFNPVPPNFKIAPGFRKGHAWRFGGMWYGNDGFSPGYRGGIWLGYSIDF